MWAALRARDAVTVQWDETDAETRGTAEIMAEYRELAGAAPAAMALDEGDAAAALAGAAKVVEASFEFPYLAHAALEPMNAVARMGEDGVGRGLGRPPDARTSTRRWRPRSPASRPTRCGCT